MHTVSQPWVTHPCAFCKREPVLRGAEASEILSVEKSLDVNPERLVYNLLQQHSQHSTNFSSFRKSKNFFQEVLYAVR